ncbi:hypothetical protein DM02DRAFT_653339 [Periconia macrospinosa]|uniref:Uncharacterized protein n=1 Tax=Periconia macrospinosa TaxID=97972 RepID=A0A2V1DXC1_9PLEO|nr:hypothetical protein DM02DRAFT_653339 [Periconia macrospinosa]
MPQQVPSMFDHNSASTAISGAGLSVLYQPDFEPIADMIFVHGPQGHPKRTWTKRISSCNSPCPAHPSKTRVEQKTRSRLRF